MFTLDSGKCSTNPSSGAQVRFLGDCWEGLHGGDIVRCPVGWPCWRPKQPVDMATAGREVTAGCIEGKPCGSYPELLLSCLGSGLAGQAPCNPTGWNSGPDPTSKHQAACNIHMSKGMLHISQPGLLQLWERRHHLHVAARECKLLCFGHVWEQKSMNCMQIALSDQTPFNCWQVKGSICSFWHTCYTHNHNLCVMSRLCASPTHNVGCPELKAESLITW